MNFDQFIQEQADGYTHFVNRNGAIHQVKSVLPMTYEQMDYWKSIWPLNIVDRSLSTTNQEVVQPAKLGRPVGAPIKGPIRFKHSSVWQRVRARQARIEEQSKAAGHC